MYTWRLRLKASFEVPKNLDYSKLGLIVGLEIHQQLDTKSKLFCNCETQLVKESEISTLTSFVRYLRATRSELGEIDIAAAFETQRGRRYLYIAPSSSSCLVELDEEPPHELNREALVIALAIAKALKAKPIDEVHVMRKIVVDGSNTTGFQRTAIIALGGYIEDDEGVVNIQTIALEEDAARKIAEDSSSVTYSLDRLCIPLIEISTAPNIRSPEQAKRVAEKIGFLLRMTGKVKRGIGTIRQDLNLSIRGSPKIEIKGVQKLELIPKVIQEEARRLLGLLMIKNELEKRGAKAEEIQTQEPIDITDYVKNCKSSIIQSNLKKGYKVYSIKLPYFSGILGIELQTNRRFGTELADYAKQWAGVRGIIHSDELPNYGIDEQTVDLIKKALNVEEKDAFVLVVDEREKALKALEIIKERACQALYGIPKETRGAIEDGTTRYLRPQPGAARMYPETDVPPIKIDEIILAEAEKLVPPPIEVKMNELTKVYGLSVELAKQILYSEYLNVFEELVKTYKVEPKVIATLLTSVFGELRSEGIDISILEDRHLHMIVKLMESYNIRDKESLKNIINLVVKNPNISYEELRKITSETRISDEEIRRIAKTKIEENIDEVRARGEKAFQFVMGKVMAELRGRADGKTVASIVREELAKIFNTSV